MSFCRFYILSFIFYSTFSFAQVQWELIPEPRKSDLGPFVTFNRDAGDEILLFADGQFLRSTDYGQNWNEEIYMLSGNLIELINFDNGLLYAQTSSGIYRSEDKGVNWKPVPLPIADAGAITDFKPAPQYGIVITSATGVFHYDKESRQWTEVKINGDSFSDAVAVEMMPDGTIYVVKIHSQYYFILDMFTSFDSGASWSQLRIEPASQNETPVGADLKVNSSGKLILTFLGKAFHGEPFSIFGTIRDGAWSKISYNGITLFHSQSQLNWFNDDTLLLSGSEIWVDLDATLAWVVKSTDDGQTWTDYYTGLNGRFMTRFLRSSSGKMYASINSGWQGIQFSEDNGASWGSIGPANTLIPRTNLQVSRSGVMSYAPLSRRQDVQEIELRGLISTDQQTWQTVWVPFASYIRMRLDNFWIDDRGELFTEYYGFNYRRDFKGIFASQSLGSVWDFETGNFFVFVGLGCSVHTIRTHLGSLIVSQGLNAGIGWTYRKDRSTGEWDSHNSARALVRLYSENANLIVGRRDDSGIAISLDDGRTWLERPAPGDQLTGVVISRSGEIIISSLSGIWRSPDQGNSWTLWTSGIDSASVSSIARNNNGIITAISPSREVYYNREGGGQWTVDENLMPPIDSASVFIDDENMVYLVGKASGLFKSATPIDTAGLGDIPEPLPAPLPVDGEYGELTDGEPGDSIGLPMDSLGLPGDSISIPGVTPVPERFELAQNYPNPFNPTTQIPILLPEDADLRVAVYDLLGRQIQMLYNGNASAGIVSLTWDGRNGNGEDVQSGIYILRVTSGTVEKSQKMVLLR